MLAWLSTAAVFGLLGLVLVVMLASPDALLEAAHRENPELADQGMTDAELKMSTYVACALVDGVVGRGSRARVATWRRVRWAAIGLAVSAGLASLLCLISVVGSLVVMLVPLAACAVTLALLLRPESLAWFRARRPRLTRPEGRSGGEVGLGQPGRAVLDHLAGLAEREPHQVAATLGVRLVVVEDLGRDRHHPGPLGQRPAERQPVRPPELAHRRGGEVGALGTYAVSPAAAEPVDQQVSPLLEVTVLDHVSRSPAGTVSRCPFQARRGRSPEPIRATTLGRPSSDRTTRMSAPRPVRMPIATSATSSSVPPGFSDGAAISARA